MKSLCERRVPPFSCHFLYPNESSSWPVLKELNDLDSNMVWLHRHLVGQGLALVQGHLVLA